MNPRVLALVGLLVAAVVVATLGGVGPLAGRGDVGPLPVDGPPATATPTPAAPAPSTATATPAPVPTATATPTPTATATPAPEPTATASGPPFSFAIDRIEGCGRTCRDVTATVANERGVTAVNTTVATRIYAGNATDGDARIWSGRRSVGTLGPGESATATQRVELGFSDALAVESEDGWITVRTTVRSDDATVTFTDRRQVA